MKFHFKKTFLKIKRNFNNLLNCFYTRLGLCFSQGAFVSSSIYAIMSPNIILKLQLTDCI